MIEISRNALLVDDTLDTLGDDMIAGSLGNYSAKKHVKTMETWPFTGTRAVLPTISLTPRCYSSAARTWNFCVKVGAGRLANNIPCYPNESYKVDQLQGTDSTYRGEYMSSACPLHQEPSRGYSYALTKRALFLAKTHAAHGVGTWGLVGLQAAYSPPNQAACWVYKDFQMNSFFNLLDTTSSKEGSLEAFASHEISVPALASWAHWSSLASTLELVEPSPTYNQSIGRHLWPLDEYRFLCMDTLRLTYISSPSESSRETVPYWFPSLKHYFPSFRMESTISVELE
ncbi:hypothetical protein VNO77_44674 [Canavalia gladiata]|uniref:Uncharacterized protein n=1 Tax=Canavalia gladiata TaxID=3824 RepID=A0AAN9JYH7_CANGL